VAGAQTKVGAWPTKPVTFLVPTPAGSPSDVVMRLLGERMQASFGQPLVVDNRSGANGSLGAAEVARARPDGQTWMFTTDSVYAINPYIYKNPGFKPEQFDPVVEATRLGQVLVCNPSLGAKTLADFIDKAKKTPMTYASGGAGSPGHMAMSMLIASAGIELTHVPYKGPAGAMNDVLGNQVPCGFLARTTVQPFVQRGQLVALATSGATRSPTLPDVPTVAESGFPGFDASFSLVLFAPHGTPPAIVDAMAGVMRKALAEPDLVAKLQVLDQEVVASGPAQTAASMAAAARKWSDLIRKLNLQLE
jgi:tripartite-type tricarboxylate transporter receptor subunit TctC